VDTVRRVASALDIRVDLVPRWRAGDLDRLLNAKHSQLHELVARWFAKELPTWVLAPEVSYAIYGERGVIDIVAWHPGRRAILVIELKTDVVDVNQLIGKVGEKARLVMAHMLFDPPNFLVLDEPTNHLDLATKEMLVDALKDFEGTMIFVSHDRMFLRGLGSRVLELGGESGTDRDPHLYPGSYVEYVQRTGHEAPGVHT